MCGRYYIDDDMEKEIEKIARKIDERVRIASGDVLPSLAAPVITGKESTLSFNQMKFGFHRHDNKGLIINARAETVIEKRSFQDSVLNRRCIIPARQYYEWDSAKTKVTFSTIDNEVLYMAGLYKQFGNEERFVILTTVANESVRNIHGRMPMILLENEVEEWIYDSHRLEYFLRKTPMMLKQFQEFTQQRLNFM